MKDIAVTVIAILAVTFLCFTAMEKGIDGAVFGGGIAAISGLGGWRIKSYFAGRSKK